QIGDAALDGPPLAAAIGNFDGVHRGHQKVVAAACDAAKRDGLMPAIITFDPHPREFFRQEDAPFHLADRAEKDRLLSNLDVDRIIHVSFDEALRRTDAEDFVSSVLPALGVKQLYAGSDFAFGRGRGGQIDTINVYGASVGIEAYSVALLQDENSVVISSTRIRAALQAGDPVAAASMLGRDWAVTGPVIKGDQRGRKIGFPTANIALETLQQPAFGVYAVEIDIDDGTAAPQKRAGGVANIGIRPTFEKKDVLCEAHLFDSDCDLYGQRLLVRLKAFLRPEQRFSGIDALLAQIATDAEQARRILSDLHLRQSG
ncbi:MAG: bifunctional riboflavin kinase/FAD synthetase, partial [Pseudomonadota bacterium]|nr:bifunctional riboflavin kinase/FAD synthetase [Pseudomonadota bacterium]